MLGAPGMAKPKVLLPALQEGVEVGHHLRDWHRRAPSRRELSHRLAAARHRALRWHRREIARLSPKLIPVIPKGVAQEIELIPPGRCERHDPRLLPIDREAKPLLHRALDPLRNAMPDVAREHHEIIRIANQIRPRPRPRSCEP